MLQIPSLVITSMDANILKFNSHRERALTSLTTGPLIPGFGQ
jgi:hypothetical protein